MLPNQMMVNRTTEVYRLVPSLSDSSLSVMTISFRCFLQNFPLFNGAFVIYGNPACQSFVLLTWMHGVLDTVLLIAWKTENVSLFNGIVNYLTIFMFEEMNAFNTFTDKRKLSTESVWWKFSIGSEGTLMDPCQYGMAPALKPGYKWRFDAEQCQTTVVVSPVIYRSTSVISGDQADTMTDWGMSGELVSHRLPLYDAGSPYIHVPCVDGSCPYQGSA